jgi:hypothetical protein
MRHQIEVTLDGQPSLLTVLDRLDDNDSGLIVHDIFVGEIMMGTVYPDLNEYTGCTDWKSDADIPVELVEQIGKAIERETGDLNR